MTTPPVNPPTPPDFNGIEAVGPDVPDVAVQPKKSKAGPLLIAGVLVLALVAALGMFVFRSLGLGNFGGPATPKDLPQSVTSTNPVQPLRMNEAASAPSAATRSSAAGTPSSRAGVAVPSPGEGSAEAIPVRDRHGNVVASSQAGAGAPPRKVASPEDAPIFARDKPEADTMRGAPAGGPAPHTLARTGDPVSDAQANMAEYQRQMSGALQRIQDLIPNRSGGAAGAAPDGSPAPLPMPGRAGMPGGNAASNAVEAAGALFGGSGGTSKVSAGFLGDRSMTMPKGTLFTCALKTRVITATSGLVGCQVQRNVFSDDGKVVLVERGSHLDGEYRMVTVRPGLTRIPVMWTRVRTPHGVTVDLDSPATGQLGESGMGGYVDNRWGERLGAAILLSLIDDTVKYAIAGQQSSGDGDTLVLPNTTEQGSKLAEKVLETTINIPPLLYNNHGNIVGVYVSRDVDFSSVYELRPQ